MNYRSSNPIIEKVSNIQGSTAGAGSGEYHRYRSMRLKERAQISKWSKEDEEKRLKKEYDDKKNKINAIINAKTNRNQKRKERKKERKMKFKNKDKDNTENQVKSENEDNLKLKEDETLINDVDNADQDNNNISDISQRILSNILKNKANNTKEESNKYDNSIISLDD